MAKLRNNNPNVEIARISMKQAIIVALITTIGGLVGGYLANEGLSKKSKNHAQELPQGVVPAQNPIEVNKLPEYINNNDFEIIKDISIFDLRHWKYTPENLKNTRHSPVNYINYLHLKKLKPIKVINAHYSTTGYAIDMRCLTHPAPFFKEKDKPSRFHKKGKGKEEKEYAMQIDVSKMEVGKEFLVVLEATYWNSFNDSLQGDASTYTDKEVIGMEELGLIVFFPEKKPYKDYDFFNTPENGIESTYISNSAIYKDESKQFIYWGIKERQPDNHYTLKWKW